MQRFALRVLSAALAFRVATCGHVARSVTQVTPIEKAIDMLNDMLTKGQQAKHNEEVQYSSYSQFCTDTIAGKSKDIGDAEQAITSLDAEIELATNNADNLGTEAMQHQSDIIALTAEQKNLTEDRAVQKTDYEKMHADYTESIIALERAIHTLRAQEGSRAQASALFLQLSALQKLRLVPAETKRTLALFLARSSEDPEAYAYEFQSGHIIDLLNDLLTKFKDKRTDLEVEEANNKHSYDSLMFGLHDQVNRNTQEMQSKTESKAMNLQSKAENEQILADTEAVKAADEAYLSDLNATCTAKAAAFTQRQQLRSDEIQSLEKAIAIISADNVTGHAAKHLPSMLQVAQKSLAMLRGFGDHEGNQEKTHEFLVEQAQKLNSQALSVLAAQVKDDDPFAKVRQMIEDLIARLQSQANDEATHKNYCDTELTKNEKTRTEKSQEVEVLHAEADRLNATIAQLTMELGELEQQVIDIETDVANATQLRSEESATNNQTVQDAREGQAAVGEAIALLKDFYAQASATCTATSLIKNGGFDGTMDFWTDVDRQGEPGVQASTHRGCHTNENYNGHDWTGHIHGGCHHGNQGGAKQTVDGVTPGAQYKLKFKAFPGTWEGEDDEPVYVNVDGASDWTPWRRLTVPWKGSGAAGWSDMEVAFTASATSIVISFWGDRDDCIDVDDVVLERCTSQASSATAMFQQDPPEIFDEPYTGMQDASSGVIGMLEVVESDFARLESETAAAEAAARAAHNKFVHDSDVDKTAKKKDIEHKNSQKTDDELALVTAERDLKSTQEALDAALQTYDTLKSACMETGMTYEERNQRREEEISSLRDALRILEGESI